MCRGTVYTLRGSPLVGTEMTQVDSRSQILRANAYCVCLPRRAQKENLAAKWPGEASTFPW